MLERRSEGVSNRTVRPLAGVNAKHVAALVRLYKKDALPDVGTPDGGVGYWAGRSAGGGTSSEGCPRQAFASAVRAAGSDEERSRLQHELTALTAEGVFTASETQAMRQTLAGAMGHDKAAREAPDEEAKQQRVFAGPEAYALVRVFDGIVSAERRERILRFVASEFQADLVEHPAADTSRMQASA